MKVRNSPFVSPEKVAYHAKYRDHLDKVRIIGNKCESMTLTMEAENNAKLLETRWGKVSRRQGDCVLGQISHDVLDPLSILGELGIVCLVSLHDLFYSWSIWFFVF